MQTASFSERFAASLAIILLTEIKGNAQEVSLEAGTLKEEFKEGEGAEEGDETDRLPHRV